MLVVYMWLQSRICGGSMRWIYRKPRNRKRTSGARMRNRKLFFSFFFFFLFIFYTLVWRRAVLCDWVWRAAGCGRPHRFPHNDFSSVYQIFTKFDHMIPLRKGKNSIYVRVIRSKFKVTITNIIFDNRVVSAR